MLPLRFAEADRFAELRRALTAAGYTEDAVCDRTGCATIYDFQTLRDGRDGTADVEDALDVLIRLFMDAEPVAGAAVESLLPPGAAAALDALGLLVADGADADRRRATVLLYPTESLHIVSDLEFDLRAEGGAQAPDVVYPAITKSCQNFVAMLPRSPCDAFLELCAGTGIAALIAARHARHVWAVDITERSTRFAEFNAALNGIENLTALQGDLYDPVGERRFDRIVAHPPYMPAAEPDYIYRDGGEDGERVTRRIIEGLPARLAPGGTFYCTCVATDRHDAPLERRIRTMLGDAESEFDVAIAEAQATAPAESFLRLVLTGQLSAEDARSRIRALERHGVRHLVGCTIVIRRHASERPAVTARRRAAAPPRAETLEWLLRREAATASAAGDPEVVLNARPRISPHVRMTLVQRAHGGAWVPEACTVETAYPFIASFRSSIDASRFLARCDGKASVREHLRRLKRSGAIPQHVGEAEFAGMIAPLIDGGVLDVEGLEPPDGDG